MGKHFFEGFRSLKKFKKMKGEQRVGRSAECPRAPVKAVLEFLGVDPSAWPDRSAEAAGFSHVSFPICAAFSNWRDVCAAFTTHTHGEWQGVSYHAPWRWMLEAEAVGANCSCSRTLAGPGG